LLNALKLSWAYSVRQRQIDEINWTPVENVAATIYF
jgi:hypothetical protein